MVVKLLPHKLVNQFWGLASQGAYPEKDYVCNDEGLSGIFIKKTGATASRLGKKIQKCGLTRKG